MIYRHFTRRLLLSASCLAAPVAPVLAQDVTALDDILISGAMFPVEAKSYGRAYSVVTAEQIEARGVTDLAQALSGLPGVAVASSGPGYTQIRLRGGESNHVLVLIDGVEANSSGTGDYLLTGFGLADVARIEVLRGPQSTLYGANAMSGVISIVTRGAEAEGQSGGARTEIGGQGSAATSVWATTRGARGGLAVSLETRATDGEDASRSPGGDTEYNDTTTLSLKGDVALTETLKAGASLRRVWQDFGYDETSWVGVASPDDYVIDSDSSSRLNQTFGALWVEGEALGGRMVNRLTLSAMDQDRTNSVGGFYSDDDAATQRAAKVTGSVALDTADLDSAAHKLNFSLEAERETYRSSWAPGGTFARNTRAAGLEYQGKLANGLDLQAGLRRDFNDVFEDGTSWNLSASYLVPGRDLKLRAALGRAIVNPTMFEQFGFAPGFYTGNPNLKPEESLSREIGADLGFAGGRGTLGVTLFRDDVDNLIQGAGATSVNVAGTSRRQGVELALGYALTPGVDLGLDYTYTEAKAADGTPLTRRPRHEIGVHATAQTFGGRGSVSADLRHVAGSHDAEWWTGSWTPAVTELPEFTTVNLAARYQLTDQLELTGRVVNLFDADYSESWGYYGQERTAYLGLGVKW